MSNDKVDYVRAKIREPRAVERHHCHWPGCTRDVPPALWGCPEHWYKLPRALRNKVWRTFKPGQEISKTPSPEYLKVAREVQDWIKENGQ